LEAVNVCFFCADHYEAYQALIPKKKLFLGKDKTHAIERNNCLQRHWFARFKRKSIVVSKSVEMVDITIRLFAAIHINKTLKIPDLSIC
jgi:insertion element IS1 protein InsB